MGRREKWFGAVKKVFSPESKRQKAGRSKDKWGFGKSKQPDSSPSELLDSGAAAPSVEVKLTEADREQSKEPYTVATMAAAAAATEATPTAAPNAAKVADLATSSKVSGRSRDEAAAIKIQTAFRGYLARRALRALRGLVRLKSLIHENSVKRQATTTLRCMQTLARVQSQIRSRRIRMSEENQALQRQLLLKRERELENLRMGEEWDDSLQSKEQIEAGLLSKQEAATRRERALAYAFSHQWKNSSGSAKPLFMDPTNPHWGWSWLERWMAAKPWESKSTTDRDLNNDCASVKSTTRSVGAEITNAYARRDTNSDRPSPPSQKSGRPPNRQSPSTPQSNALSAAGRAVKSASPRSGWAPPEDDARSITSIQSERPRRHSLAGSSVRDDESLASSPAVPSYMVPTKSARAKSRFQNVSIDQTDRASDKGSVGSVKKRLSFPVGEQHGAASPVGVRRHSDPPKVSIASVNDVAMSVEL